MPGLSLKSAKKKLREKQFPRQKQKEERKTLNKVTNKTKPCGDEAIEPTRKINKAKGGGAGEQELLPCRSTCNAHSDDEVRDSTYFLFN